MSLKRAAIKVLKPYVAEMRSYASTHPMPSPPERRSWPTANFVWSRYVTSMITAQTRSSRPLWDGLRADPAWRALRSGGPQQCPNGTRLASLLKSHGIRFPVQKATRIRRAVDRDFDGLAAEIRTTFARIHDRRVGRDRRRDEEVRLSVLLQDELAGCGVAPKIARLLIMGATEITQVIPIDSRWQNALAEAGYAISVGELAREDKYRALEDVLCEVSYELGVRPTDADGIPFGWLLNEGV